MTAEAIYEVIKKLTGDIVPVRDSAIDHVRLENVKTFIQVFDKMHTDIDDIAYRYKDSRYASECEIGKVCSDHLDKMGIES
ncbi:MAG: hypothetical protein WC365_09050 [Candidatus Babeliales bacterium]|jgi:hypothetical protein